MVKMLKPLVMMQLKDKIDLSYLRNKKQAITKIILSILAFGVITAVIYVLLWLSRFLKIFHLVGIIPTSVMVVVFSIMEILALISCTFGFMKTLFFARDNQVLLTMPVSTNQVFVSKFIVYLIYELKRTLYFMVPLFLAYGISVGIPLYFYPWLIFCWLLVSVFNVSVASLFSIIAMGITILLRNYPIIKIILLLGIVGVSIWGVVSLINLIPEDLDIIAVWGTLFWEIQGFLNAYAEIMWPFTFLTQMIIGGYRGIKPYVFSVLTIKVLLVLVVIMAVLLVLAFLLSRPLFFKMAAKPFEYKKTTRESNRKNIKFNSFWTSVNAQLVLILRTTEDLSALMGCAISMPILILLLNRIFAAMSTRMLGDHMTVVFNMLIILLVALASNTKIASIYSREGAAAYLNKTRPNRYVTNLIAKLVPNAVIMTISIISSCSIFANFTNLTVVNKVCFALAAIFAYLLHLLWSAEMDIMNPQSQQYATTGEHNNNPNETKSTVVMFIMSVIIVGIGMFLSLENVKVAWIKVSLICLTILIFRIWSYISKVKYYYKEKQ